MIPGKGLEWEWPIWRMWMRHPGVRLAIVPSRTHREMGAHFRTSFRKFAGIMSAHTQKPLEIAKRLGMFRNPTARGSAIGY